MRIIKKVESLEQKAKEMAEEFETKIEKMKKKMRQPAQEM